MIRDDPPTTSLVREVRDRFFRGNERDFDKLTLPGSLFFLYYQ